VLVFQPETPPLRDGGHAGFSKCHWHDAQNVSLPLGRWQRRDENQGPNEPVKFKVQSPYSYCIGTFISYFNASVKKNQHFLQDADFYVFM